MPEDDEYESARNSFMSEGHPAMVVRPTSAQDIAAALRIARDEKLELSVRSGGHSGSGFSTNDGGLVIDLSDMKKIEVIDAEKRLVRIDAGANWGEVAATLKKDGLALSSGDTLSVGVGGIGVGGGIGWMVRKYGLAIDSMTAAEVVTADGHILRASKTENTDLFWAVRGAGGNYGVVSYFEFEAQPERMVYAGVIQYGLDDLRQVMTGWRDCMRQADDNLTTMLLAMPPFMGNPSSAMIMCCYAGDDETAARNAIQPLLELGNVVREDLKIKEYADVLEEAHPPQGVTVKVHDGFVPDFSDELIEAISGLYNEKGGPVLQIRALGGAMNRVPADETAFAHRNSEALIVAPFFIPPDSSAETIGNIMKPWETIEPFTAGVYGNLLGNVEVDIDDIYPGQTYKRLVRLKKQYDPKNLFSRNFNIRPQ